MASCAAQLLSKIAAARAEGVEITDNAEALVVRLFHAGGGPSSAWRASSSIIELLTNVVLVAIAICLGPFIKRFGRAYAADVFRASLRTGTSYLVLTDIAYYLIFTAFILFTTASSRTPTGKAARPTSGSTRSPASAGSCW